MRLIRPVVAVILIAVAGCGGDDSDTETGAEGEEGGAASREIDAEAQERAESIVLQLSDFPEGWRASTAEEDEDGDEFFECIGLDRSDITITGEADSQDFAMGDTAEASSEVRILESAVEAEQGISEYAEVLADPIAERCMTDLITEGVAEENPGEEIEVGEVDLGELSFTPPSGVEEGRAWEVAIPIEVEGFSPTVYLDFVFLRQGDAVVSLTMEDILSPFDSSVRDELLQAIAARMSSAPEDQASTETTQ